MELTLFSHVKTWLIGRPPRGRCEQQAGEQLHAGGVEEHVGAGVGRPGGVREVLGRSRAVSSSTT
ncbi:hypothetical protein JOF29_002564 [Kribbella aluminosa]|uniref:Uncharacterized protein n=1 Tax=Kribbella aluminosa TaxID=416017 RepID=A0ABS4UIK2_9ACTN|nr:hypothetical protein [Kribbella aluminosa]MBP2351481.1 hypothetical protein [Kribbella aluminosa]